MTVFNIAGIGSYDYDALLKKQAGGQVLSSEEQNFVLAFNKEVLSGEILLSDAGEMNESELLNNISKLNLAQNNAQVNADFNNDAKIDYKDIAFTSLVGLGIADTNNDGSLEDENSYNAIANVNPIMVFAYQPNELSLAEEEAYSVLLSTQKTPLDEDDLSLILKNAYNNDASDLFKSSLFANVSEAQYVSLMKLLAKDGATANEVQSKLVHTLEHSTEIGFVNFTTIAPNSPKSIEIGGKTYSVQTKSNEESTFIWDMESEFVVFMGDNLVIEDSSADGQDDNILLVGDDNKLKLRGGNNSGYVIGDSNSVLGGSGKDTIYVEGDKNYIDTWKGDDSIFVLGDENIAYGMLGADNFFVKGNSNFVEGEIGADAIHDFGASTIKKNIETVAAWTESPDNFKELYLSAINKLSGTLPPIEPPQPPIVQPPTVQPPENPTVDNKAVTLIGDQQIGKVSVVIDGIQYELTVKLNYSGIRTQEIKSNIPVSYYIQDGKLVIEGDHLDIDTIGPAITFPVDIKGSDNNAKFSNVTFNGASAHTFTLNGTQFENVENGTHEYNYVFNGKTYLISLTVENGPQSFDIKMTENGSIIVTCDQDNVEIESYKLPPNATAQEVERMPVVTDPVVTDPVVPDPVVTDPVVPDPTPVATSGSATVSRSGQTMTIQVGERTLDFNVSSKSLTPATVTWSVSNGVVTFKGQDAVISATSDSVHVLIDGKGITYNSLNGRNIIRISEAADGCVINGGAGVDLLIGYAVGNYVNNVEFINFIQTSAGSSAKLSDIPDYLSKLNAEQLALLSSASKMPEVSELSALSGSITKDESGLITAISTKGVNVKLSDGNAATIYFDSTTLAPTSVKVNAANEGIVSTYGVKLRNGSYYIDTANQAEAVKTTVDSATKIKTFVSIGAVTKNGSSITYTQTTAKYDANGVQLSRVSNTITCSSSFNPYTDPAASPDSASLISSTRFERRYNADGTLKYISLSQPATADTGILSYSYNLSTQPPSGIVNYYAKRDDGSVYVYKKEEITYSSELVEDGSTTKALTWTDYTESDLSGEKIVLGALRNPDNFAFLKTTIYSSTGVASSSITNKYVNGLPIRYLSSYSAVDSTDSAFTQADLFAKIYSLSSKVTTPTTAANYSAGITADMINAAYNSANCTPELRAVLAVFTDGANVTDTFKFIASATTPSAYTTTGATSLITSAEMSTAFGLISGSGSTINIDAPRLQRLENLALFRKAMSTTATATASKAFANKGDFINTLKAKLGNEAGAVFAAQFDGMFNADGSWNTTIAQRLGCTVSGTTVTFNAGSASTYGFMQYGQNIEDAISLVQKLSDYAAETTGFGTFSTTELKTMYENLNGMNALGMALYVNLKAKATLTTEEQTTLNTLQAQKDAKAAKLNDYQKKLLEFLEVTVKKSPTSTTTTSRVSFETSLESEQLIEQILLRLQNNIV